MFSWDIGRISHGFKNEFKPTLSLFFFPSITLKLSHLTFTSKDSSMVEESPDTFQLYRDREIPSETTATRRELPTIHTYRVIMLPAGLEPTRQRCVASRGTNLATDLAIPTFCELFKNELSVFQSLAFYLSVLLYNRFFFFFVFFSVFFFFCLFFIALPDIYTCVCLPVIAWSRHLIR